SHGDDRERASEQQQRDEYQHIALGRGQFVRIYRCLRGGGRRRRRACHECRKSHRFLPQGPFVAQRVGLSALRGKPSTDTQVAGLTVWLHCRTLYGAIVRSKTPATDRTSMSARLRATQAGTSPALARGSYLWIRRQPATQSSKQSSDINA